MIDPRAALIDPADVLDRTIVGEGCWLWTGASRRSGYGQHTTWDRERRRNVTISAHRLTYELFVGPVPAGMELDHLCRVRDCVRPDHLEAVTHAVNVARGRAAERTSARAAAQTRCKHGHPLAGDNLYRFQDALGGWHRCCVTCRRSRRREWDARQKVAS